MLQEAGGQLERAEIRDRISEKDEKIAEFEQKLYTSNKTGSKYKKFDFKFNFALKELSYLGFLTYCLLYTSITRILASMQNIIHHILLQVLLQELWCRKVCRM